MSLLHHFSIHVWTGYWAKLGTKVNVKITDLGVADNAAIFAESLEVLVMVLEALHKEAKPLGLQVFWAKTKVQVFGDLLDEIVQSIHVCGENIEYLGQLHIPWYRSP